MVHHTSDGAPAENQAGVELVSAARTTTQTGSDHKNLVYRGLHLVVDLTAFSSGSLTPKVQGKDGNGIYYDLLVGPAIAATGTTVLKVYPGLTPSANAIANDFLPSVFRIILTVGDATSITYSVSYNLCL